MLTYEERLQKLRTITDNLDKVHYQNPNVITGICTNAACDCIVNVEYETKEGLCPNCGTPTVQSILVLAGSV